ncbi:MAG: cysteine synthase A [Aerococcus sp.]|nr:cysteine synthase A [Aerococcus sp.]
MLMNNILESVGNTPLVQLQGLPEDVADVYVKIEADNPSFSIKDRAVKFILNDLMEKGQLKPGDTIIEETSGNTGIGLSAAGAALGLNVIIVMPETMSDERKQLIRAYGATLELTPGSEGMQGAADRAEALAKEKGALLFGQFTNDANVKAHYETTGPEIMKDLPDVDAFVAGVGTGGTVTGVSKYLKEQNTDIQTYAVEPADSPLLSEGKAGSHKIQGIGANFVPQLFDKQYIDHFLTVTNEDAMAMMRRLASEQGILAGISSGANVSAALRVAKELGKGKKVVTVLPDTGERYLSAGIFGVE